MPALPRRLEAPHPTLASIDDRTHWHVLTPGQQLANGEDFLTLTAAKYAMEQTADVANPSSALDTRY